MGYIHKPRFTILAVIVTSLVVAGSGEVSTVPGNAQRPTDAEIAKLVFDLAEYPLSKHISCDGVALSSDSTIGDFLGNTWIHHTNTTGQNFLVIVCEPLSNELAQELIAQGAELAEPNREPASRRADDPLLWAVEFRISRQAGNEWWSWGIGFIVRDAERTIVPGTIRCLVAG